MVKNPFANAGDVRNSGSILDGEDLLKESMATHSSILAWRIPMDRGTWAGYSPRVHKESDMIERLSTQHSMQGFPFKICRFSSLMY